MSYELCRHIKVNGLRCKAMCITGEFWCYFHTRLHFRHRCIIETKPITPRTPLYMPVLEDRESVQVAISLVAGAIATGHINEKRAATLIRILTLASRNVGKVGDLVTTPAVANSVSSYFPTLDGRDLADRRMDDDSDPPEFIRRSRTPNPPAPEI